MALHVENLTYAAMKFLLFSSKLIQSEWEVHIFHHRHQFLLELPTQKDVEQWVHADVRGGKPEAELLDKLSHWVITASVGRLDLLKGVWNSDNVIWSEWHKEHNDDEKDTQFDLVLSLVVIAARVSKRLDDLVCDANVANCNDHTDEPEENIHEDYYPSMECSSNRSFQVHAWADLFHIGHWFIT